MSIVSIRNWREYQHYKDRKPPWVKLHVKVLDDETLRALGTPTRLVAFLLLAVAANKENRIPADPAWLSVEIGMSRRLIARALDDLLAVGYLECSEKSRPRDRERDRDISKSSSNGYVDVEHEVAALLKALEDKDAGTERTIRSMAKRYHLAEGDFAWALECASGPGVKSPTRVAVAELRKRGESKEAA